MTRGRELTEQQSASCTESHPQARRISVSVMRGGARGWLTVPWFRVWHRPSTHCSCRVGISTRFYP